MKRLTLNESIVMDNEFKKWMSISDKMQGFADSAEKLSDDVLKEQTPTFNFQTSPTTSTVQTQIPIQSQSTVARTTTPQTSELQKVLGDRNIQAALVSNPALRPLVDALKKLNK